MKSYMLGLLDNSYYLDRFSRKPVPLFSAGWGNIKAVVDAYAPLLHNIESGVGGYRMLYEPSASSSSVSSLSPTDTLTIRWNPYQPKSKTKKASSSNSSSCSGGCCRRSKKSTATIATASLSDDTVTTTHSSPPPPTKSSSETTVDVQEGTFRSPQGSILPPESSDCKFLMVVPKSLSNDWRPWLESSELSASESPSTVAEIGTEGKHTSKDSRLRNRKPGTSTYTLHHSSSPSPPSPPSPPPPPSSSSSFVPKILLWLPATGEQSYNERLQLATVLAKEFQCISLIIMAPFYASRKEHGQEGASVSTVGYYLGQSLAIMTEAAVLVVWLNELYQSILQRYRTISTADGSKNPELLHISLTGFSWGAAMSGCAGILSSVALAPSSSSSSSTLPSQSTVKISVIPYVGSTSPAPVVDGILSGDIAWQTLTEQGTDVVNQIDPTKVKGLTNDIMEGMHQKNSNAIRKGLLLLLSEFNNDYFLQRIRVRYLANTTTTTTSTSNGSNDTNGIKLFYSLCSCCAKNDWFLGSQYSNQLHVQLAPLVYGTENSSTSNSTNSIEQDRTKVRQIWLDGGHVYAYVHRQPYQLDALRWILKE